MVLSFFPFAISSLVVVVDFAVLLFLLFVFCCGYSRTSVWVKNGSDC